MNAQNFTTEEQGSSTPLARDLMIGCGASIFPSWLRKGGGPAPSTLLNGLVSYWSLDELSGTRADSIVASGNDLTDNNSVGYSLAGPSGTVASFVATNSESLTANLTAPANSALILWFRPNGSGVTGLVQLGTGAYGQPAHFVAYMNTLQLVTEVYSNAYASIANYNLPAANEWHMLYLEYNGTTKIAKASLDGGALTATAAQGSTVVANQISFGALAAAFYSNDKLGRSGLWSQALDPSIITSLFNSGNGKAYADLTAAEKVGLVSYWNLDEVSGARADSHGTNTLTDNNTVGSATAVAGAMHNVAASFVAANTEWLSVADNASLDHSTTPGFTLGFWSKLMAGTDYVFIDKDDNAAQREWLLNGTVFYHFDQAGGFKFVNTAIPQDGTWHMTLIWWDSVDTKLHCQVDNGLVVDELDTLANLAHKTSPFRIGVAVGGYTNGVVDEVAIWHRALTSDERTELYNAGAGKFYPFS